MVIQQLKLFGVFFFCFLFLLLLLFFVEKIQMKPDEWKNIITDRYVNIFGKFSKCQVSDLRYNSVCLFFFRNSS